MSTAETMLECRGVTSGYKDAMVIRDISFSIARGNVYAILGKNGMGKSTLMKTIMGLLRLSDGRVGFAGDDITGFDPQVLVHRGVAYIPQESAIFQDLSVEENLRLALRSDKDLGEGLEKIAQYFPVLPERRRQKAGTLSGGEQKMLLMARALIMSPKLILMDEISEGLQPLMVARMEEVVARLTNEEGATILMAEQNVGFVSRVSNAVGLLKIGQMVAEYQVSDGAFSEEALLEAMRD